MEMMMMKTQLLKVTGMTCSGCVQSITRALKAVAGVDQVEVNLPTGETSVQFDETLATSAQLLVAVSTAGFGVELM
jgi:copper chaperone CopZ